MCICSAFLIEDVKLYAVPASVETGEAQSYLQRKGIHHEMLDSSTDAEARSEMLRLSAQTTRPVIVVGDTVFVGFAEDELEAVMP